MVKVRFRGLPSFQTQKLTYENSMLGAFSCGVTVVATDVIMQRPQRCQGLCEPRQLNPCIVICLARALRTLEASQHVIGLLVQSNSIHIYWIHFRCCKLTKRDHRVQIKVVGNGIHKTLQLVLGTRIFKWCPMWNFLLIPLHQYENLLVRFVHLSRVSGIPEMWLGNPATKHKFRFGHPLMKCHFFVWWCAVVYTKYSVVWRKIRIKWPNAASIALWRRVTTTESPLESFYRARPPQYILGCPKLEFRAPALGVGPGWTHAQIRIHAGLKVNLCQQKGPWSKMKIHLIGLKVFTCNYRQHASECNTMRIIARVGCKFDL